MGEGGEVALDHVFAGDQEAGLATLQTVGQERDSDPEAALVGGVKGGQMGPERDDPPADCDSAAGARALAGGLLAALYERAQVRLIGIVILAVTLLLRFVPKQWLGEEK